MTRTPLRAYWWQNPGFLNIGDAINGNVLEYISGRKVERAGPWGAEIIAIGSVLDNPMIGEAFANGRGKRLWVWGSGAMDSVPPHWLKKMNVAAVRGALTASMLDAATATGVLGDPGLLAPRIWQTDNTKTHKIGLIPHHSQLKADWVARFLAQVPSAVLIDVTNPDFAAVFNQIAGSEMIFSSSLHGLIFADAWHVPNFRINAGRLHRGGDIKFRDYYSGVLRPEDIPFDTESFDGVADFEFEADYFNYFKALDLVADRLERAFPEELKEVQTA
ncbi:polysaccharide pyruvyl transferase family protein [Ketogulonicigenium vulgare]|nr:polysaccharide pyruvyl transferase family protein [Ketogulonicigenium vulgare]ADO42233.1 exoV domain-containing protein [Ketogulonicigenium vulgare Y25]ALJ80622.1 exov protein [Ketogulonicigenium vulgare]ANW33440.1 exov protein [Ketogulonicigenium vulgare]AOZ54150.1 putative ketal pyruvate transferase PssM [Ketogulonicigenium vulgare]